MAEKKEEEQKRKLVDAAEVLADMEHLERFNGVTEKKIVDNWYQMKNSLLAIITEKPEDEKE